MREWIDFIGEHAIVAVNAIVLATVIVGTITAFFQSVLAVLSRSATEDRLRRIYLHYGHWLIAALTFQIAADVIGTSIAPTWKDIGQLAAIAAIRVFLNFFLERDMSRLRHTGDAAARPLGD